MDESKSNQVNRRNTGAILLLSVFMLITFRFPVQFVEDLYQWTGILYITICLLVLAYAAWVFRHRISRLLASILIVITLVNTAVNFTEFQRSKVFECEFVGSTKLVCSMAYTIGDHVMPDGWVEYLAVPSLPIGIQTVHQGVDLFMLF